MTGAADWQGRVGRTWAEEAERTERAFAGIATALDHAIADMAPAMGTALDIGCGVGSTALSLAAVRPDLSIVGADLSADLVAVAQARAIDRIRFVHDDALRVAAQMASLDLLVSRHGVMFFDDPVAAFTCLHAAVRPDAPLIFSCFGPRRENAWARALDAALDLDSNLVSDAPGPFAFAESGRVSAILDAAGWRRAQVWDHEVPYVVGVGVDPVADALAFFRRIGPAAPVLAAAPPDERGRIEDRLRDLLAARTRDGAVAFTASIRIWHAVAGERA
jgi:SAM-dependent methyltransferase